MRRTMRRFSVRFWLASAKRFCISTAHCDRIDSASKLNQHAIAHQLDDAAMVLGDQRGQYLAPPRLQHCKRPRLVLFHKSAVADHICGQDCGKAALDPNFGHG